MAKLNQGLKAMIQADLVPEMEDVTMKIVAINTTNNGWEIARCVIKDPEDDALVGRNFSIFLCNEGQNNFRGVTDLMKSLQMVEPPQDENGEQTTKAFLGAEFQANIRKRDGKRGPENVVYPIIDNDWVAANVGGGNEQAEAPKRRRRRRS